MSPEALASPALGTPHGFFTRRGGVSLGPWASLNCSLSSQDDPAHVAENRARATRHLGARRLLGVTQVHGADVATVLTPWLPGHGPRADAMVTALPGIALGIITADCTPVLLHDPVHHVIGAVHAGWKGALAGVLEATIVAMQALGATSITAAIGPCIRQDSYEVGADLRGAILAHDARHVRFFAAGRSGPGLEPRWQFDLPAYCATRLHGLAAVDIVHADTLSDETRFFSHRRRTLAGGGPIGHQLSAILLAS